MLAYPKTRCSFYQQDVEYGPFHQHPGCETWQIHPLCAQQFGNSRLLLLFLVLLAFFLLCAIGLSPFRIPPFYHPLLGSFTAEGETEYQAVFPQHFLCLLYVSPAFGSLQDTAGQLL